MTNACWITHAQEQLAPLCELAARARPLLSRPQSLEEVRDAAALRDDVRWQVREQRDIKSCEGGFVRPNGSSLYVYRSAPWRSPRRPRS